MASAAWVVSRLSVAAGKHATTVTAALPEILTSLCVILRSCIICAVCVQLADKITGAAMAYLATSPALSMLMTIGSLNQTAR